jgi:hypothetical protein
MASASYKLQYTSLVDNKKYFIMLSLIILGLQYTSLVDNKKYFIMLSMIILGPNCMIGEAFDVCLQPLSEELKQLWEVKIPT